MSTVKEIMNALDYDVVEFYRPRLRANQHFNLSNIHGDTIRGPITNKEKVFKWRLMYEEEYNSTIFANTCNRANFAERFGDEYAKILIIVLYEKPCFFCYEEGWYFEFDHMGCYDELYYGDKFSIDDNGLVDPHVALTYDEIKKLD